MALRDPEEARKLVTRFLSLLTEIQNPEEAWEGRFTNPREEPPPKHLWRTYNAYWRALKRTVIGLQPLMEELAQVIDPRGSPADFREFPIDGWEPAEKASLRLIGILDNTPNRERIFGPLGPVLVATGLHKWVWNSAADLWDNGHYKAAVHAAWNAVEQQTQLKLKRSDVSGKDLYAQAFSTNDKPERRLRFPHINAKTEDGKTIPEWTSAHEGAMQFGMGCAQGIRNLQIHSTEELNEQEALEYLASLSVLARWVDAADIQTVPAS